MILENKFGNTDLLVSRIGLGTTEIGYEYGFGHRPLPSEEEAISLLKKAVELGITTIDTAHFYGLAEERIGKSKIATLPNVVIMTKCAHFLDRKDNVPLEEARRLVCEEIENSLQKLLLTELPLVLFHGGSKEQIENGFIPALAREIRNTGKVKYLGISTRGEEASLAAIRSGVFQALQVSYNIFDQRVLEKVLPLAEKRGIGVINRSVFLKGILTGNIKNIPPELPLIEKNLTKLHTFAAELKIDLPTLAIRFAISNPQIHTSLIGTNKITHLEKGFKATMEGPLPKNVLDDLKTLAITEVGQIDPKGWSDYFKK